MTRRGWPLSLALLAVLAAGETGTGGGLVQADEPTEDRVESRRRFDEGETHFKQGRYAEALVAYEAGYRAAPLAGFLIDIAHCHRMLGDLRKARAHYRKFVLVSPQSPRRQEVESTIADLDKAIAAEPAPAAAGDAPAAATAYEATPPVKLARAPIARWWLWTALASSVVGGTVASLSAAAAH